MTDVFSALQGNAGESVTSLNGLIGDVTLTSSSPNIIITSGGHTITVAFTGVNGVEISGLTTTGSSLYAGRSTSVAQKLILVGNDDNTGVSGDFVLMEPNESRRSYIDVYDSITGAFSSVFLGRTTSDRFNVFTNSDIAFQVGNGAEPHAVSTKNNILDDGTGTIIPLAFQMVTGASSGYILTSDASGNGTWQPSPAASGTVMVTGTYTGDGNATQAITGLGITPRYLRIYFQEDDYTIAEKADIDGLNALITANVNTESGIYAIGFIVSLDTDGFTVSILNNVDGYTFNDSGATFTFVAWS